MSDHRTARALGAVRWRCLSSSVAVGAHAPSQTWRGGKTQKPAQLARLIKRWSTAWVEELPLALQTCERRQHAPLDCAKPDCEGCATLP